MTHTYRNHNFHLIWSTKHRENIINISFRDRLHGYMGGIIKQNGGSLLEIGGIENHVHLLIGLGTLENHTELIRKIKGGPSVWVNNEIKPLTKFGWQEGYGSFGVSYSLLEAVRKYIQNQEEHHKNQSFEDEYLKLLRHHGIQYDDKYALD